MDDPIFDPWCLGDEGWPTPSQRASRWRGASAARGVPHARPVPAPLGTIQPDEDDDARRPRPPVAPEVVGPAGDEGARPEAPSSARPEASSSAGAPGARSATAPGVPTPDAAGDAFAFVDTSLDALTRFVPPPDEPPVEPVDEPAGEEPDAVERDDAPREVATLDDLPDAVERNDAPTVAATPDEPSPALFAWNEPASPVRSGLDEPPPAGVASGESWDGERATTLPAAKLRALLMPRIRRLSQRLVAAHHRTTVDDRLATESPSFRFRIEPWVSPFDEPDAHDGAVLEVALEGSRDETIAGRFWLDPYSRWPSEERSLRMPDLEDAWLDSLLLDFVAKALRDPSPRPPRGWRA